MKLRWMVRTALGWTEAQVNHRILELLCLGNTTLVLTGYINGTAFTSTYTVEWDDSLEWETGYMRVNGDTYMQRYEKE